MMGTDKSPYAFHNIESVDVGVTGPDGRSPIENNYEEAAAGSIKLIASRVESLRQTDTSGLTMNARTV